MRRGKRRAGRRGETLGRRNTAALCRRDGQTTRRSRPRSAYARPFRQLCLKGDASGQLPALGLSTRGVGAGASQRRADEGDWIASAPVQLWLPPLTAHSLIAAQVWMPVWRAWAPQLGVLCNALALIVTQLSFLLTTVASAPPQPAPAPAPAPAPYPFPFSLHPRAFAFRSLVYLFAVQPHIHPHTHSLQCHNRSPSAPSTPSTTPRSGLR